MPMKKKTLKQLEDEYDRTLERAGMMSKRKLLSLIASNDQVRQTVMNAIRPIQKGDDSH